jgi:hypothetical protein
MIGTHVQQRGGTDGGPGEGGGWGTRLVLAVPAAALLLLGAYAAFGPGDAAYGVHSFAGGSAGSVGGVILVFFCAAKISKYWRALRAWIWFFLENNIRFISLSVEISRLGIDCGEGVGKKRKRKKKKIPTSINKKKKKSS